jgi:TRAP-type C4-dicarboxylate transport system permease small subunit
MMIVTALVFAQVLLRYVFKAPLMGIEEILLFPTVWLYFIGAINASSERTQIVARVLEVFVKKEKTIFFIRMLASVLSFVIILWLNYWAYDFLKYSLRMQKVSATLYIPLIYSEAAVFIGMIVMTFYTAIEIFHNFNIFKNGGGQDLLEAEVEGGEI